MRWKMCVALAAAVACAEPTRPETPVGAWTLVAVGGASLPAPVSSDAVIVGGTLVLRSDGTYEETMDARVGGALLNSRLNGRWRSSGNLIEFLERIVGLPFVGRWSGAALVVQEEFEMRYAR